MFNTIDNPKMVVASVVKIARANPRRGGCGGGNPPPIIHGGGGGGGGKFGGANPPLRCAPGGGGGANAPRGSIGPWPVGGSEFMLLCLKVKI